MSARLYRRCERCGVLWRTDDETCNIPLRANNPERTETRTRCEGRMLVIDGCQAFICHGPGHQSTTRCRLTGEHEVHEAIYGSYKQLARWRDGSYTDKLRAKGIEFNPNSYPDNMAMTGFFDEPPNEDL